MNTNDKTIDKELEETLEKDSEAIALEKLQLEGRSPSNHPFTEKSKGIARVGVKEKLVDSKASLFKEAAAETIFEDSSPSIENDVDKAHQNESLNAPKQWIKKEKQADQSDEDILEDTDFQMPISLEKRAVSTLLGMTNTMLLTSTGYFVKIDKDNELYQSEKLLKIIDQQNAKNLTRVLLDKEDKALLKPLILQLFRNSIHQITPEQQLLGAAVSILIKKVHTVIEIRLENRLLEEEIFKIVSSKRKKAVVQQQDSEKDQTSNGVILSELEEFNTDKPSLRDVKKQESSELDP